MPLLIIFCSIVHNSKIIHETKFSLNPSDEKVFFATEEYQMSLKQKGDQFVLQVYDRVKPMRSYSEAPLREAHDKISLSLWDTTAIIETSCERL